MAVMFGPVLLEARGVGRRRPDQEGWLLRDVDLTLSAGDRLAIEGESGAGKSLLLRALGLLDPLESGEIRWHGEAISGEAVPRYRSQVIYLQQAPALDGETVEAILRRPFALGVHQGKQFDWQRVLEALSALGRDRSFLAKSQADLSGGEAQITALLRALQLDASVLLLDEPTAALDRQATHQLEQLVAHWLADGKMERAYVWVSHDETQATRVSDRRLTIERGALV